MNLPAGDDEALLATLLRSGPEPVSGEVLAGRAGTSRVAVWSRLERLRAEGVPVVAERRRGYRIEGEPAAPHPAFLRALLAVCGVRAGVLALPEVDSTNDEAARQLAAGRPTPFAVVAAQQTRGRGRLGRTWHSPDEGNLYLSVAFRPEVPPGRLQGLTVWLGLHLAAALERFADVPIGLKWPNDLLAAGRKVGGLLAEARVDADRMRDLVFGCGINVNADPSGWPPAVAAVAGSLASARQGRPLPWHGTAAAVLATLVEAEAEFRRLELPERTPLQEALWERHDALRGRAIHLADDPAAGPFAAVGLAPDGGLRVRGEDGRERVVHAGEVTLGTARLFAPSPTGSPKP